jgi:uncharacterized protein YbaP (TraB family)
MEPERTMTLFRSFACSLALALASALAAPPAAAAAFLWEVIGLTNRAYLYGTVHAGKREWFPLAKEVEDAFNDSKVLVVEADVSNTAAMAKYGNTMAYTAPDTLKSHVSPEDYERFRKLLPRYQFPESQVAQMKPFLAVSLLVFGEWARQGYQPQYGIDGYLIARAKGEAKPIVEIEGIDTQMRLMDSLTEQENRTLFASTLYALETGLSGEQITGLVKAWQGADPDGLLGIARSYNAQVKGAAEFEEKFIWSRHEDMLKKIDGYLTQTKDRHFIAVGSLHLAGPRGLVEQLRQRGYVVRQK